MALSSSPDGLQTPSSDSVSRKMWIADDTYPNLEPYVSTSLSEGPDSMILGCSAYPSPSSFHLLKSGILGDGRLRRASWANLSIGKVFTGCSETSNIPLNGEITSLHFVEDDRTKEPVLVGGADDGSLAFWSSRCAQPHHAVEVIKSNFLVLYTFARDGRYSLRLWHTCYS
jgi:hypothetical protein